jgi:hypothetical protein
MKTRMFVLAGILAPFCLMAVDSDNLNTWAWDTANNTVTFSGTTSQQTGAGANIDIAKFSSAIANIKENTSGQTYTLSAVIVSISGSITDGYFTFSNAGSSSALVDEISFTVRQYSLIANGVSLVSVRPIQDATIENVSVPANANVWGSKQTTGFDDITLVSSGDKTVTSGLDSFVGDSGTYPISISYKQAVSYETIPGVSAGAVSTLNTNYTIKYIYTVPEPTTAALAFAGLLLLGIRRRHV